MEKRASKPQYRTLVRALAELEIAAFVVLEPFAADKPPDLGPRMRALRRAAGHASEVVGRARAAMTEKARRKDGRGKQSNGGREPGAGVTA
jgi:hypothetical protein